MTILTCKQSFDCISLQIFSKLPNFKIMGLHQPPPPSPNFESLPYPRCRWYRFEMFSLKWREMMNLKIPGANFPLWCAFWAPDRKLLWVVVATSLRRTRVNAVHDWMQSIISYQFNELISVTHLAFRPRKENHVYLFC